MKGIPGWERYADSCDGRVMALSRAGVMTAMSPSLNKKTGYFQLSLYSNNKPQTFPVHRLIAGTFLGLTDEYEVDHINLLKTDNRVGNLRVATRTQNAINKFLDPRNMSGYAGVRFHKAAQKWVAEITVKRSVVYLGLFGTVKEAVKARIKAEQETYNFSNRWEDNILTKDSAVISWLENRAEALKFFAVESSKRTTANEWLAGENPQKFVADHLEAWMKDNPFPEKA